MNEKMTYNQQLTIRNHVYFALLAILLLIGALSCGSPSTPASSTASSEDSLIEHINQICLTNPEAALALLDSAETNHLLKTNDINGLRAVIYQNAFGQSHVALAYSRRIYESPEAQHDTVILTKSLKQLAALNYRNGNYGEAIRYAQEGSALAHATNDWMAEAFFLQYVGFALSDMYQIEEALTYIDRSIELYQQINPKAQTWKTADDLFYVWIQKVNILFSVRRYAEAIALFPLCEAALQQLAESEGVTQGMLDTRTAQLCGLCMICYVNNHEPDKAKPYYERFRSTTVATDPSEVHLLIPYLIATQQYQTANSYLRQAKQYFEERRDTIHSRYIDNILVPTLQIQEATGQTTAALASARQIIALKDSLFARENEQKTIEMAAIYETEDKAHQIEQQKVRLQHGRIVLQLTLLLLFVACVVIALIVRYNLLIRKKNRAAVATIHELMAVKGKWTERTDPQLPKQPSDPSQPPTDTIQRLMKRIEEEELFRNANFSRNEAIALVPGLSLKNFSLQFNKCVGNSFPRYLNNLRLEYSLGLLRSTANYSIEGIALDSGFSCRQTYHRLFVERFGLTPTEYRNAEKEEERQCLQDQSEA